MAVTDVIGKPSWSLPYSKIVDNSADYAALPTDTIFIDKSLSEIKYKNTNNQILSLFSSGGDNFSTSDLTFDANRTHDINGKELTFKGGEINFQDQGDNQRLKFNTDGGLEVSATAGGAMIPLLIKGSNDQNSVIITNESSNAGLINLYEAGVEKIRLKAESNDSSYINNGGSFGVGTDSPSATLHIEGQDELSTSNSLVVYNGASTPEKLFEIKNSGQMGFGGAYDQHDAFVFRNKNSEGDVASFKAANDSTVFSVSNNGAVSILNSFDPVGSQNQHSFSKSSGVTTFKQYNGADVIHELQTNKAILCSNGSDVNLMDRVTFSNTGSSTTGSNFKMYQNVGFQDLKVHISAANNTNSFWMPVGTGKFGFGTETPSELLHVKGSLRIEDGTEGAGKILSSDAGGKVSWIDPLTYGKVSVKNSNGQPTYYATLQAAIDAAVSGETIELHTDIDESGDVEIALKTGLKINGNGHKYTLSSATASLYGFKAMNTESEIYLHNIIIERKTGTGGALKTANGNKIRAVGCVFLGGNTGSAIFVGGGSLSGSYIAESSGTVDTVYMSTLGDMTGFDIRALGTGIGLQIAQGTGEASNGKIFAAGNDAVMLGGALKNCDVKSTGGIGIYCAGNGAEVYNVAVESTANAAVRSGGKIYNSTFISSGGTACNGISGGNLVNCSFFSSISSAISANSGIVVDNCHFESSAAIAMYTQGQGGPVIYKNSTFKTTFSDPAGNAVEVTSTDATFINCVFEVKNTAAYGIKANNITMKYLNCAFKGMTTAVSSGVTQGAVNNVDVHGNILI